MRMFSSVNHVDVNIRMVLILFSNKRDSGHNNGVGECDDSNHARRQEVRKSNAGASVYRIQLNRIDMSAVKGLIRCKLKSQTIKMRFCFWLL